MVSRAQRGRLWRPKRSEDDCGVPSAARMTVASRAQRGRLWRPAWSEDDCGVPSAARALLGPKGLFMR